MIPVLVVTTRQKYFTSVNNNKNHSKAATAYRSTSTEVLKLGPRSLHFLNYPNPYSNTAVKHINFGLRKIVSILWSLNNLQV